MADLKEMTLSNDFADYIIPASDADFLGMAVGENYNYQYLNSQYLMLHLNSQLFPVENIARAIGFSGIPSLFTLTSTVSLEASGIPQVQSLPTLRLDGQGVLIGFLDTGINYTHPAFMNAFGKTRILRIWDQTIQTGTHPKGFVYGSEYNQELINLALEGEDPYELVPSRDTNGHGTLLAGIACGSEDVPNSFQGAAPKSSIAVVKLKEAKEYLREYYRFNGNVPMYQETDILLALRYLNELANSQGLPLVICLGLGTNQGSHNGNTALDQSLLLLRTFQGQALVASAGNEVGRQHHFSGTVPDENSPLDVEISVPANTPGFSLELWGMPPETFSIGAISPLGEVVERIPARMAQYQSIQFILDRTLMQVQYELVETVSGEQVILIRFLNPTQGLWRIRVYCSNYITGQFHMWLPAEGMVDPNVTFLSPDPYTTILIPGNTSGVITTAAYNAYTEALYPNSSRGFTPMGIIKPDLTSPGVGVTAPDLLGGYGNASGTGASASLTAGVCALILQWGMTRTPMRRYNTNEVKNFLIRGAVRDGSLSYPNREWGYGKLNIYNVFTSFLNS